MYVINVCFGLLECPRIQKSAVLSINNAPTAQGSMNTNGMSNMHLIGHSIEVDVNNS